MNISNSTNNICYYCKKNFADPNVDNKYTMYQIVKLTTGWLGFSYSTKIISIPRCGDCYKKHGKLGSLSFFIILPLVFIAWFIWMGDITNLVGSIVVGLFVSIVVAGGFHFLVQGVFFKKKYGIIAEDDVDSYPEIEKLLKLNWKKHRPDPAGVSKDDIALDSPFVGK